MAYNNPSHFLGQWKHALLLKVNIYGTEVDAWYNFASEIS